MMSALDCKVRLLKSHREGIADGGQRCDFIYVDDALRGVVWLVANALVIEIYSVGTGKARSLRNLIVAAYAAAGADLQIEMPTC